MGIPDQNYHHKKLNQIQGFTYLLSLHYGCVLGVLYKIHKNYNSLVRLHLSATVYSYVFIVLISLQTFVNDIRIPEQTYVTLKLEDKLRFGYDILLFNPILWMANFELKDFPADLILMAWIYSIGGTKPLCVVNDTLRGCSPMCFTQIFTDIDT